MYLNVNNLKKTRIYRSTTVKISRFGYPNPNMPRWVTGLDRPNLLSQDQHAIELEKKYHNSITIIKIYILIYFNIPIAFLLILNFNDNLII